MNYVQTKKACRVTSLLIFFFYKNSKQYLATILVDSMMVVMQSDVECVFHVMSTKK